MIDILVFIISSFLFPQCCDKLLAAVLLDHFKFESEYNLDLPLGMSFPLIPHLPRYVGWGLRTTASDRQTDRQTHTLTDRQYVNLYIDIQRFISVRIP